MHDGNGYVGVCRVVALGREGKDQSTWRSTSRGEVARQLPRGHRNFTHHVLSLGCIKHIGGHIIYDFLFNIFVDYNNFFVD
ncbi:unnamed protein product [Sphenostylis stenocarpa]|uniref:Uncharacterized protein n=1 Tax=Sphenostylis stenocarpa TaxID=92480 RepID=A0AA86SDS4_9FABA|nr:unnamed protein product [Sphenostylis stenocarpa]